MNFSLRLKPSQVSTAVRQKNSVLKIIAAAGKRFIQPYFLTGEFKYISLDRSISVIASDQNGATRYPAQSGCR